MSAVLSVCVFKELRGCGAVLTHYGLQLLNGQLLLWQLSVPLHTVNVLILSSDLYFLKSTL
jgi:hypothetical protein